MAERAPRGRPRGGRNIGRGGGRTTMEQRDRESEAMRRQIEELTERLARLEGDYHGSDLGEDEEVNPFADDDLDLGYRFRARGADDPSRDVGMKVDIPEFEGKAHPDDFIDWVHTVERVFDIKELSESNKVKLVAIKLKKHASIWWEHVKRQRLKEGKSKVETWAKMKKLLTSKFLPEKFRQDAFIEYHNLRQRLMTVEEFTAEFDRLRMRCDVVEEDEETVARYLAGLRREISDVVELQQYFSYGDVCRLASRVEKQLKARGVGTRSVSRATSSSRPRFPSSPAPPTVEKAVATPGEKGASSSRSGKVVRCFRCQGLGHMQSDCPNKQMVTLLEEDYEVQGDPVYDASDSEHDDEVVYADHGEALVVRRLLSVAVANDDLWLRHNIFHTKCTAKGKVCDMIIDGGSCENVVSTTMVEKLGLPLEEHPQPYKLSWLKRGNEVKVSKRCLVQFSIGKTYQDEVWCDVVPMDACHLLLGRPWQFDRRTKHGG